MWQLGLGGAASDESYPQHPNEADCTYYLRTGFCGFGSRCRFNHPRDRGAVNSLFVCLVLDVIIIMCIYEAIWFDLTHDLAKSERLFEFSIVNSDSVLFCNLGISVCVCWLGYWSCQNCGGLSRTSRPACARCFMCFTFTFTCTSTFTLAYHPYSG